MIKLTTREQLLFNLLKAKKKLGVTTSELMEGLKENGIRTSHHSLTVTLKYLSFKVSPEGWIIDRPEGGVGRGNEARYQIRKAF